MIRRPCLSQYCSLLPGNFQEIFMPVNLKANSLFCYGPTHQIRMVIIIQPRLFPLSVLHWALPYLWMACDMSCDMDVMCNMWNETCNMWHETWDMWHVTWHVNVLMLAYVYNIKFVKNLFWSKLKFYKKNMAPLLDIINGMICLMKYSVWPRLTTRDQGNPNTACFYH